MSELSNYRALFHHHRFKPQIALLRSVESWIVKQHIDLSKLGNSLDIGCGNGEFAASLGVKIQEGLDASLDIVESTQKKGIYSSCHCGSIEDLELHNKQKKELVIANSVFEHVEHVEQAISIVHRIMQPGGQLIMTVPLNIAEQFKHLEFMPFEFHSGFVEHFRSLFQHRNMLDSKHWLSLLTKAGFKPRGFTRYIGRRTSAMIHSFNPFIVTYRQPFINHVHQSISDDLLVELWIELLSPIFDEEISMFGSLDSGTHLFVEATA